MQCVPMPAVKPKVLALGMYAIDVEPIPSRNRNNREVHLDYLKHLKENVEILCEIVEEARIEKPLDNALGNACFYTKRSQELLEYVIDTFPKEFNKRDKKVATTPLNRKNQVTFKETCGTSNDNTHKHFEPQKEQKTNVPVIPFTGVISSAEASGSKPRRNTKNNRILPAKSDNKKKVEDHPRNNKLDLKQKNRVDSSISSKRTVINSNSNSVCKTCNKCLISANHDKCVVKYLTSVNAPPFVKDVLSTLLAQEFVKKFTGTVRFENDHFGAIMGYGDYTVDLEVAFRKHSCYVRNEDGVDLLKGLRGSNLYTIPVEDIMKSSLICLLSKASKNKSWLGHHRLNHLNFGAINDLARKDLVRALPRLKFEKDNICSACQLGKSKKYTHKPKFENTIMEVLHTLHMDLCGPMSVEYC
ncbi:retrovirus-related pol polyprotein from transposon TNT 1-94 [Tanacetum coccineum]